MAIWNSYSKIFCLSLKLFLRTKSVSDYGQKLAYEQSKYSVQVLSFVLLHLICLGFKFILYQFNTFDKLANKVLPNSHEYNIFFGY